MTSWKFIDLIQVPSTAMGSALIPICSAAFAMRDMKKVRAAYKHTMIWAVAITTALAIFLFVFSDQIVMIFSNNGSSSLLMGPMSEAVRIYVLIAVMFAAITVSSSLLQSMMKADRSMWSTLIRNIALVVSFGALCHTTPVLMWWGFVASELFGLIIMCGWAELMYRKELRSSTIASLC